LNIHKLKVRKVAPVVVPIIVVMTLFTGLSLNKIQDVLTAQAYSKLTTSRDMKKQLIEDSFKRMQTDIEILSSSYSIKGLVNNLELGNEYLMVQSIKQHEEFLRNYTKKYNYMNMLIISAEQGTIQYTQSKVSNLGEDLNSKNLKGSQLAELWRKVKASKTTRFVDMKAHQLFGGRATMFVATPIYINGVFKSVLVLQISDQSLSEIIHFKEGYAKTQKDYIIGSDKPIIKNGKTCAATHSLRVSILNLKMGNCNNEVTEKALCGKTDRQVLEDCDGTRVLSAYAPLKIGGDDLNWAIISDIDEKVVLSVPYSIKQSAMRDSLTFISILAFVIFAFIYKESKHEEEVDEKNREMNETLQTRVAEEVIKNREHQELLFQQSKMASMGEMIGNIAHQWRQPLNALSALNVGLAMKYSTGKLTSNDVTIFKEKSNYLIQRMSDTINDFRNFFYPNKSVESFRVNEAIEDAINFIKSAYGVNNIKIINYTSCKLQINNHRNELIQVLLNIFNNSKDAIKEFNSKNGVVLIDVIILEESLKITIQDNGGGIDQGIIDRVFEPYFTTKFKDDGTGIGLYMSKMIVEESMGGRLKLENRENGVLTTIILPIN
jgi:signal transduction histidine kinase